DRNRSHWSTSKTPSYTKSVSWQHHQRSVQQLANTIVNSLIQYDDPAAWTEQEQLLKQMTVENVNTAVKQYLSHPVNTYTGVLLPK
ncbi:hypothetical protein, partial [Escherichia coli]|uniref:hypothetical protein n=1 Tax=Escherichia coli TaxID=562 RepID=UPI002916D9C3